MHKDGRRRIYAYSIFINRPTSKGFVWRDKRLPAGGASISRPAAARHEVFFALAFSGVGREAAATAVIAAGLDVVPRRIRGDDPGGRRPAWPLRNRVCDRRRGHGRGLSAALNHPNILAVYDIGTEDGAQFIVSELLEGATGVPSRRAGAALPDVARYDRRRRVGGRPAVSARDPDRTRRDDAVHGRAQLDRRVEAVIEKKA